MTTEEELLEKKKELEDLQRQLLLEMESIKTDSERKKVHKIMEKIEFRRKHPKLLKITNALGGGTKSIFKTLFSGIKKIPKGLAASDEFIRQQRLKEIEANKTRKKDTSMEDALYGIK
jgi:hypothetical protein